MRTFQLLRIVNFRVNELPCRQFWTWSFLKCFKKDKKETDRNGTTVSTLMTRFCESVWFDSASAQVMGSRRAPPISGCVTEKSGQKRLAVLYYLHWTCSVTQLNTLKKLETRKKSENAFGWLYVSGRDLKRTQTQEVIFARLNWIFRDWAAVCVCVCVW